MAITVEIYEEIRQCREKYSYAQRHTAHRIFTRLCEEKGYMCCESAVRAAVAERRKRITNCFVPLAYDPGESMQIDWGETTVFLKGVKIKVNIWCMRECFSADIFVMAFMRQNEESFLEGILNGFEYFGGVPRKQDMFNAAVEELQSRAERLGRNGHVRKERSVNIPVRFTFISAADYFGRQNICMD